MAGVFSNAPDEDDDESPGMRLAGSLTGDDDEGAPDENPAPAQPQGTVDSSAQSYLTPAEADEGTGEFSGASAPDGNDTPVSADTKAYMTPVAAPTLAAPKAYADHSADTAAMTAQKTAESQQDVKPSGWRKAGAILAGIGTLNVRRGIQTAEDVMNQPRVNAQRQWATQEAPIQARLSADAATDAATRNANVNTEQANRLAETNYSNQIRGQQDAARAENYKAQADARNNAITSFTPDDPANPYAGGTGTTADGRTVKGVPPPDKWLANWEKNPDNVATAKANAGVKTLKALEASGVKLTPEQRAIVASGGKVTPAVHTNISILENPDGSARLPAGAAGQAGPSEIIAQNMQNKQAYIDSLTRQEADTTVDGVPVKAGLYDKNGSAVTQQQFNDRLEKFRTDLNANPVMRKSGTMVDPQGNTVTNRFSRNPQSAPPAAAQPQQPVYKAKSGATVTVNTHVVVNGRPGVVTGFDANGKPQVNYGGGSGPPNPR
jgi:hypothetical protein